MNRREALRTLAAGGATGAIAAGAIVATVPAEAITADPCLAFLAELEAVEAEMERVRTAEDEALILPRFNAVSRRIPAGEFPKATTAEGAAKLLRRVVDEPDFVEPPERNLILAALAYLEGRTL